VVRPGTGSITGRRRVWSLLVQMSAVFVVAMFVVAVASDTAIGGADAAAPEAVGTNSQAKLSGIEPDRSPVDLVLAPDERWLATANQTSDSVSLVGVTSGRVLSELTVGRRPAAIALHPDGERLLVSCSASQELHVLRVDGDTLSSTAVIQVPGEPHGLAIDSDGRTAYVAQTSLDRIAVVDLVECAVVGGIDVGRWPRFLALSPDGSRLAVGVSGDRGVAVVDPRARELLYTERFVGLNIGHLQASADGQFAYFPWMVYRRNPISPGNIRLGWVLASRIARVRLDGSARREAVSLDPPGKAIADPHGLALTRDEQQLVVSAAGTHELLVYRLPDLPLQAHGGTDHVPPELLEDADRFARIELGGRPLGLRIAGDDRTVFVANYLGNSVQVVDLIDRQLTRTIPLGGPAQPSLERQGEAIFYDARRSLDQWYSCHSCHYEGGTNSVVMDTLNDGTRFTFKSIPALHHLGETAPWTWHGWQTNLLDAMHKSLTDTMQGSPPNDEDKRALAAYLCAIEPPPNPHRLADGSLNAAAERGRAIFASAQAGCAQCHSGPLLTDGEVHDVGTGSGTDRYDGFNTPSLIGVFRKTDLLHDGRANSLETLLTGPHAPDLVAGDRPLNPDELRDLVEYLKSL